ncbi:MAG: hypothetical protein KJ646_04165, partial [Nanoarchaeota archaeon]|nr:hypothetical protein [Nanoarchaeota archaeon]
KKCLKDKNAAVIVYDEFWEKYTSFDSMGQVVGDTFFQRYKYGQKLLGSRYEKLWKIGDIKSRFYKKSNDVYNGRSLDQVATLLAKQGVKNIFFEHSCPGKLGMESFYGPATKADVENLVEDWGYSAEECAEFRKDGKPILIKEGDIITQGNYTGNIAKHGKPTWKERYGKPRLVKGHLRKESLKFIHDLKQAGKEAGEEINQQRQKRNSLESEVTVTIALAGVVSGLIFLSPNLTGNVIGNLSNSSSNIIGGVLFLIGLVGAFFSIRGR